MERRSQKWWRGILSGALFLFLSATLVSCSTGGYSYDGNGGNSLSTPQSSQTLTASGQTPTGPILFLNSMPGICNDARDPQDGHVVWNCQRPCDGSSVQEGFNVGNDGDTGLSWAATISPSSLTVTPDQGMVPPYSRAGQAVSINPPNEYTYQIIVTVPGQSATTINVSCG